jgi:transposase
VGVKRKQLSAEFKARVAMASLSGEKTLTEAAPVEDVQKVIDDLHRKIGQLQAERDFLAGQPAISRALRGGR